MPNCACSRFTMAQAALASLAELTPEELKQHLTASLEKARAEYPVLRTAPVAVDASSAPTLLFHGGTIRTMRDDLPTVEALVIQGKDILGAGTLEAMRALAPAAQAVDLAGRTLMPGFVDPHMHAVANALLAPGLDLGPVPGEPYTFEGVKAKLRAAIQSVRTLNDWIIATGFDSSRLPEWENITVDVLDELFGTSDPNAQNPLFIASGSGHTTYANRRVLQLAGVPEQNPPKLQGGKIATFFENGVDTGRTSGIFIEYPAQKYVLTAFGQYGQGFPDGPITLGHNLAQLFSTALANGNTMVNEAALGIALNSAAKEQAIIDAVSMFAARPRFASAQYVEQYASEVTFGKPDLSDPMFLKQAVKLFADGSNQGVTGLQRHPYTPWAIAQTQRDYLGFDANGNENLAVSGLSALVRAANEAGWQVMTHANGDAAIDNILAAYHDAKGSAPPGSDLRNRVEHCSILHDGQIAFMKDLDVVPSFLIQHVAEWGWALKKLLGNRADLLDRCYSAEKAGLRYSLHSDYSVSPMEPLRRVQTAVTRIMDQDPNHGVLNPGECVSVQSALKAQTIDAAWQCHAERYVGSLEAGKLADLVILDTDPCACPPTRIAEIKVLETWVNGAKVYSAEPQPPVRKTAHKREA
ncbi:twin-arginine translocation signal domain protein [Nitrospirillum viridazoti Y2]|nr:twin-arginine translocation signal domain protein [Nitrospirillum amazonense Y2]